ncbi:MAG: hypothetical protein QNJ47_23250 [Nostocaceae cyanobacterium]|nr:hypothetical protein [Nostocaceae cyanobacterium]
MLKTQKLLSVILLIVLMIGCRQNTSIPNSQNQNQLSNSVIVTLDSQFGLKAGQVALIESEKIKIQNLQVEEDSRCPDEVQCVWAGQVKVKLNVVKNQQDLGEFNLISRAGAENLAVKTFDGYAIKVIEVAPYPKQNQKPEQSDYIVTLVVSRKA